VHWDLGSVAPLLRLAPERRLRVRLRVLLLARSGTNQRLDSAPWFDVGTGIRARGLLWQLADRKQSFLMSSAAAGMRRSWP
jgi:hypothetical protein